MADGRYDDNFTRYKSHAARHEINHNHKESKKRNQSSQPHRKHRSRYVRNPKNSKNLCNQIKNAFKIFSLPFWKNTPKQATPSRLISSNSTLCTTSVSFSIPRSQLKNSHRPICPEEMTKDAFSHHYKKAYYWDDMGNLRKKYFLPTQKDREDWTCFHKSNKAVNLTLKTTSTSSFLKSSNPASKLQLIPKRSYQGFRIPQRLSQNSDLYKKYGDSRDCINNVGKNKL